LQLHAASNLFAMLEIRTFYFRHFLNSCERLV
jgi:hypothetical protein